MALKRITPSLENTLKTDSFPRHFTTDNPVKIARIRTMLDYVHVDIAERKLAEVQKEYDNYPDPVPTDGLSDIQRAIIEDHNNQFANPEYKQQLAERIDELQAVIELANE